MGRGLALGLVAKRAQGILSYSRCILVTRTLSAKLAESTKQNQAPLEPATVDDRLASVG